MRSKSSLTTAQILDVFSEEIAARDGRVTDTFHRGKRLFVRSVVPLVQEVQQGDRLQGGVALKATSQGVWLYPYVFRLVCRNGAITAETIGSHCVGKLDQLNPYSTLEMIREGIAACCAEEVFSENVRRMRCGCQVEVDMALNLLPMLSGVSGIASSRVFKRILDEFFKEGDQTQFGLANAVTAVARDIRNPKTRWELEELGGGIAVAVLPELPGDDAYAELADCVA
jgi:hypothetical protein